MEWALRFRELVVTESGFVNLEKVDHIVVLMLENRSFDHMLGYLSLEGGRSDVDGLRAEFANEHDGRVYPIHHLDNTAIEDDPDHAGDAVDLQLGGGKMDGFVESFAKTLTDREVQDGDPGRVMGYYNAADVPVYDHLAREFAICDRWFKRGAGSDVAQSPVRDLRSGRRQPR
jgi:phospholipase C